MIKTHVGNNVLFQSTINENLYYPLLNELKGIPVNDGKVIYKNHDYTTHVNFETIVTPVINQHIGGNYIAFLTCYFYIENIQTNILPEVNITINDTKFKYQLQPFDIYQKVDLIVTGCDDLIINTDYTNSKIIAKILKLAVT